MVERGGPARQAISTVMIGTWSCHWPSCPTLVDMTPTTAMTAMTETRDA
jgi:hypothetical protein